MGLGLARPFDFVAQHGTTNHTNQGGYGTAVATTDVAANGTARHGTHDAARTRFLALHLNLLLGTDLARHRHLGQHRGGGNHAGRFLLRKNRVRTASHHNG